MGIRGRTVATSLPSLLLEIHFSRKALPWPSFVTVLSPMARSSSCTVRPSMACLSASKTRASCEPCSAICSASGSRSTSSRSIVSYVTMAREPSRSSAALTSWKAAAGKASAVSSGLCLASTCSICAARSPEAAGLDVVMACGGAGGSLARFGGFF